ncbi:MAG: alpha/beta hydrolase [Desulfobacterales bacterium]|jgi:pimeloyl-ACP methyl ester carboxylesterase
MKTQIFSINHCGNKYEVATNFRQRGREMVFLIHGLGCSKASFRDIWQRDEFSDYSILAIDLIGFGDSAKSEIFSYKMEDHAAVCAQVVKQTSASRVHIVAHSMGGAIGLLLPTELFDSVKSFANLEGNLTGEQCGFVSRKTISVTLDRFEEDVLPDLKSLSKTLGEGRFFLDSMLPFGFYKSAESLVDWSDSGELLSRFLNLPCNKSYFYGQENAGMAVLDRLDDIEKVMIDNSGHFLMNDNPNEFYVRLREFLTS